MFGRMVILNYINLTIKISLNFWIYFVCKSVLAVCPYAHIHMFAGSHRSQKRASDALEPELPVFVKLSAFKLWAIPSALPIRIKQNIRY